MPKKHHMGVSKNNGTPKSSILKGLSIINHPFWGPTPIFANTHIEIGKIFCPNEIFFQGLRGSWPSYQHHKKQVSREKKKKNSYFPLNPGCLIGILISWVGFHLRKKKNLKIKKGLFIIAECQDPGCLNARILEFNFMVYAQNPHKDLGRTCHPLYIYIHTYIDT